MPVAGTDARPLPPARLPQAADRTTRAPPRAQARQARTRTTGGTSTPAAPFRSLATQSDPGGDAGLDTPPYADLRSVTLAANGTDLRVTVTVDGALPDRTDDGETIGIGVDLYPPQRQRESDYQLFVDGEPDGWFAYLDTPRGFVRYPGTFGLGSSRLVFTVPLSSVGSPRTGRFSAFVDWSRTRQRPHRQQGEQRLRADARHHDLPPLTPRPLTDQGRNRVERPCPVGYFRLTVADMSPTAAALWAAPVNLNHPGHYLHWGVIQISVANLVVILVMIALFVLALLLPFPRGGGRK